MKNKTLTAWLALLGGPFGLHRFYLFGRFDSLAWLLPIPTALGLWGFERVAEYGVDDILSWWLIPIGGVNIAACALMSIVYGLMSPQEWSARFNPQSSVSDRAAASTWLAIGAVVLALLVGTTVLLSSLVYSIQRYFETQIEKESK